MSVYSQHKTAWSKCTKCVLHETREKVVCARGNIPADVMFLGEAPGASENVLGYPFAGPAGHLLDRIIETAFEGFQFTYALTNLVGCIPIGEEGTKTAEPPEESIRACAPRVVEITEMCNPQLIVCVGTLAKSWLDKVIPHRDVPRINMIHPAAIMRMDISQKGLAIQRAQVDLAMALEELTPF